MTNEEKQVFDALERVATRLDDMNSLSEKEEIQQDIADIKILRSALNNPPVCVGGDVNEILETIEGQFKHILIPLIKKLDKTDTYVHFGMAMKSVQIINKYFYQLKQALTAQQPVRGDDDYQKYLRMKDDYELLQAHSRNQSLELDAVKRELAQARVEIARVRKALQGAGG